MSTAPKPKAEPVPIKAEVPPPIPDIIRETLNLKEDSDEMLVRLATDEKAVLLCVIAPYRAVRISPVEEVSASIGLHEEFAFEALIDEINTRGFSDYKIMCLLNSPGGGLHSSFKVARALRQSFKEIEIYVPHMAASGGTLIALTGQKIVMGIMSQLSPLDPQVIYKGRQISALCFRHAYDRLCEKFEKKAKDEAPYPEQALVDKLDPYLMEDWNCSIGTAEQYVEEILKLAGYGDNSPKIARELIHNFVDHDSDINVDTAEKIGLRVEKHDASERNKKIWRLFRYWLGQFLFQEAGTHVIRYVLPGREQTSVEGATDAA